MKRYKITTTVFLVLFLVPSFFTTASSEIEKASIQYIINSINSIKEYHVNLNTKIYRPSRSDIDPSVPDEFDPNDFMSIRSVVFGKSGEKMKLVTTTESPELGVQMEIMLIFDGTWLWVQQKVNKHPQMEKNDEPMISAMKFHIQSVSPDPVNEPFNTVYGASGTGLFRYKDLPGTFFQLIEDYDLAKNTSKSNLNDLVFTGLMRPDKQYSKIEGIDQELAEFADATSKYCTLWISEDNGYIRAYSLGRSVKRPINSDRN